MNSKNTVEKFIKDFEDKFRNFLVDSSANKTKKPITNHFRYYGDPSNKYSDWDLYCWIDPKVSKANLSQIDKYVRNLGWDIGLFSCPAKANDVLDGLQYMGFMPEETYAPFIDLHLKIHPLLPDLWSTVFFGDTAEHKKWALLTSWRKLRKPDPKRAKEIYESEFAYHGYGDDFNEFIANPLSYYLKQFPASTKEQVIAFLNA